MRVEETRSLLDLEYILHISKFHMVSIPSVLQLLKFKCWFIVIDLKELQHHRYLHFLSKKQNSAFPFGLTPSPEYFLSA